MLPPLPTILQISRSGLQRSMPPGAWFKATASGAALLARPHPAQCIALYRFRKIGALRRNGTPNRQASSRNNLGSIDAAARMPPIIAPTTPGLATSWPARYSPATGVFAFSAEERNRRGVVSNP